MGNPFLLPPQSVISFSGGRTSGFMLKEHIAAHGGTLPDDRKTIFCNTGKEMEETLEFVERCSQRFGVPVTWLEYRWEPGRHYFEEVNFATASRNGEPFEMLIKSRKMLPNPVMRTCTIDLKLRTTNRYVRQVLGWETYTNAVGFRHDEPARVATLKIPAKHTVVIQTLYGPEEAEEGKDYLPGEMPITPLDDAGISRPEIREWWARNDFDLDLEDGEGNCDLCFLKGGGLLVNLIAKRPHKADWWIEREREREMSERSQVMHKRRFALFNSKRPPYAELLQIAMGEATGPATLFTERSESCGMTSECRCTD